MRPSAIQGRQPRPVAKRHQTSFRADAARKSRKATPRMRPIAPGRRQGHQGTTVTLLPKLAFFALWDCSSKGKPTPAASEIQFACAVHHESVGGDFVAQMRKCRAWCECASCFWLGCQNFKPELISGPPLSHWRGPTKLSPCFFVRRFPLFPPRILSLACVLRLDCFFYNSLLALPDSLDIFFFCLCALQLRHWVIWRSQVLFAPCVR